MFFTSSITSSKKNSLLIISNYPLVIFAISIKSNIIDFSKSELLNATSILVFIATDKFLSLRVETIKGMIPFRGVFKL
jgi:hypothetical protein